MTIRPLILLFIINSGIFVLATGCSTCMATDKELASAPVSFTKPHEYFDYLSSLPETIKSVGLRTWTEIDANMAARKEKNRSGNTIYDTRVDAVRFSVLSGNGSVKIGDTVRIPFPETLTGTLLLTWDSRWEKTFSSDLLGVKTQKSFQLAAHHGRGDKRRLEIRSRFSFASIGAIASIDLRRYNWRAPGSEQPVPGQVCDFAIRAGVWTRYWAWVDFDNLQFSLWVADETSNPVTLFDRLQFSHMDGGLNYFWFEHNSSQKRDGGRDLHIWGRNFVALRNVANPKQIVAMGAKVIAGEKSGEEERY